MITKERLPTDMMDLGLISIMTLKFGRKLLKKDQLLMSLKLADHSNSTDMVFLMMKNVTIQDGVTMLLLLLVMVKWKEWIIG